MAQSPEERREASRVRSRQHYRDNKEAYFKRAKTWARARKIEALEMCGSTVCTICGEDRPWCLSFHHRDPSTKGQHNSKGKDIVRLAYDDMIKELALCDVVCENCHRDIHYTGDE